MKAADLHILADENIPLVQEAFRDFGRVRLLPGRSMTAADVRLADVLLVRSVTPVGPALLEGSQVRFVGSATIGTDHVDRAYLRCSDIAFAHAPGANAGSVVEYVLAALLELAVRRKESLRGKTVGIVGCGNIGGQLARRLPALGLRVLKNDPPRAEREGAKGFLPLADVLEQADIVTLHVPLSAEGDHPTYHLIGSDELCRMKDDAWLLNTSRGAVVDNEALKAALAEKALAAAVLDVWEGEPTPDPDLVRRTALATPHIAGYSYDGKVAGTIMLYRALVEHLGLSERWDYETALAPRTEEALALTAPDPALPEAIWLHRLVKQMYDIAADDMRFRKLLECSPAEQGAYFSRLRKDYPRRRSFSRHVLPAAKVPDAFRRAAVEGLDVQLGGATG